MREHQNDVSMDVVIGEDVRLELPEPRPYTTDRNKPLADEAGIFPCMVFVCGSNIGSMVVWSTYNYYFLLNVVLYSMKEI